MFVWNHIIYVRNALCQRKPLQASTNVKIIIVDRLTYKRKNYFQGDFHFNIINRIDENFSASDKNKPHFCVQTQEPDIMADTPFFIQVCNQTYRFNNFCGRIHKQLSLYPLSTTIMSARKFNANDAFSPWNMPCFAPQNATFHGFKCSFGLLNFLFHSHSTTKSIWHFDIYFHWNGYKMFYCHEYT